MWFAFGLLVLILVPVAFVLTVRKHSPGSFAGRATGLLWTAGASLIAGLFGLLRSWDRTDVLHSDLLTETSVIFGLSCLVPFVFIALHLLGKSKRAWLVIAVGLGLGIPGFVLFSYALMREANIHLDSGAAGLYELRGVSTEHVASSPTPSNPSYYVLRASDWPPELPHPPELRITANEYEALQGQDRAIMFVRSGALGYAWVERVLPVPAVE